LSWWTTGSEGAALGTLLAAFRQANPGVDAVNAAVAGGAGSQAVVELARRLRRDDPPDVWQAFAGESVRGYAQRGVVRDVSAVFTGDDLGATMQPDILRSVQRGGRPYGVPTGAHRSNVLWFNTGVLARAGVAPPSGAYRLDALMRDLRKVKAAGVTPLCLGGRDAFTTAELFENVLLGEIGASGWSAMAADRLNWRGTPVRTALDSFGDLLAYADPQAGGLTWDAATKKLATGGCAFESMNDSAYGELIAGGAREGTDFGAVAFPGTGDTFLAVVDVFVAATKAENAKNALAFLAEINKPATQVAFSRAKGSVPVVRTVDVSSLPPYQRNSSKSLWASPVLLSVAHGEAMSPRFQEGFYDAVSAYVRTRDPGAFADDLQGAIARERIPPR
jgi:glucose/mannose transport system substrate-binding protein